MSGRVDAEIEKILPLVPLKDAANLTPQRAREELTALADSRKDLPLPQPAAVADITIRSAVGPIAARVYRPAKMPAATVVSFHGGGWVAGDINTDDRNARTLAIELEALVLSVDYRRPPETAFRADPSIDGHARELVEHGSLAQERRLDQLARALRERKG
jgi:acetyl esterase